MSFFQRSSWTQLHKIEHSSKTDLLIEKRKPSDFGWIISLRSTENHTKICLRMAELLWYL